MSVSDPTFIGQVASVAGGIVRVRLRDDMPTTLVMIDGESYRIGQIGAFFRIPLGYTSLYAVCTQVGADAAPRPAPEIEIVERDAFSEARLAGFRWMAVVLFGECVGRSFDRGVGQYPTVGDEVHVATRDDLRLIYSSQGSGEIAVGTIAASSGVSARLDIGGLVSRHCAVVGSTGAGKSNLVTVLLEALSDESLPSARVLVVDPHGEFASALGPKAHVFKLNPVGGRGERQLRVPFWALSFSEIQEIVLGGLQPPTEATIRDLVLDMKKRSAALLANVPPEEALTADSPVPFSLRRLWFELDDWERRTYRDSNNQTDATLEGVQQAGNPETVTSNSYPAPTASNTPPYPNRAKRNISRQLELMRSRLRDARFSFLFDPGGGYSPDTNGRVQADLDSLVRDWVGHEAPVTVLDVSGVPSEILALIVGSMLRVVYDTLFWAMDLPVGGRAQPLLIVLEEAHRFLPEGVESPARRTLTMIAKEGRKYGVGLAVVTQRPSEIDSTVLSQCGTMICLRITNSADRSRVAAAFPDDLGGLADLLPALRTGEGLFLGEALKIPSRVRIRKAGKKPIGDDPELPEAWQRAKPDAALYGQAVSNWRASRKVP